LTVNSLFIFSQCKNVKYFILILLSISEQLNLQYYLSTNEKNAIYGRGWISSARSYFCIQFRYKYL